MISARVLNSLIHTSICSNEIAYDRREKLHHALARVVEAAEFVSARQSKDENYIVRIPGERLDEISQALRELERALKECGA